MTTPSSPEPYRGYPDPTAPPPAADPLGSPTRPAVDPAGAPATPVDPLADLRSRPYVYRPPLAPPQLAVLPLWPVAPPPTKGRPRQSLFFILLVVVALGCSSGGFLLGHARNATPTAGPTNLTGTASAAPAPSAPPSHSADGKALLARIVAAPHGAKKVTIDGGVGGVFDLSDFADHNFPDDPAETARMRARQFEWMAERGWIAHGVEYHIELVEFADGDGAGGLLKSSEYDHQHDPKTTSTFPVGGLSGAMGYETTGSSPHTKHIAALFAGKGGILAVIYVYSADRIDDAAAGALLLTQIAALPG